MNDLIPAGLVRRSAERIYESETAAELGAMVEEAQEGCDEADALIDLELGDAALQDTDDIELEGDDDILEAEVEGGGEDADISDTEEDEILSWTGEEGGGPGDLTEAGLAGEALII